MVVEKLAFVYWREKTRKNWITCGIWTHDLPCSKQTIYPTELTLPSVDLDRGYIKILIHSQSNNSDLLLFRNHIILSWHHWRPCIVNDQTMSHSFWPTNLGCMHRKPNNKWNEFCRYRIYEPEKIQHPRFELVTSRLQNWANAASSLLRQKRY